MAKQRKAWTFSPGKRFNIPSLGNILRFRERPWKNAFFLLPLVKSHKEFVFEVEGDKVSFLWHIPITDEERAYRKEHGTDALIDRMEAVDLPWAFNENNRFSMLE